MKTKLLTAALAFMVLMLFCATVPARADESPIFEWINPPFEAIVTVRGEQFHFKAKLENGALKIIEINGVPQDCSYIECGEIYPWGNLVVSGSAKYAWASRFLKTTPYGDLKPTLYIYLDASTACSLSESIAAIKYFGEALMLPYYAPTPFRGIVQEYLCTVGIGTNAYYVAHSDSNTDGSLSLWIPADDYNLWLWQTTHSLYIGTPKDWYIV